MTHRLQKLSPVNGEPIRPWALLISVVFAVYRTRNDSLKFLKIFFELAGSHWLERHSVASWNFLPGITLELIIFSGLLLSQSARKTRTIRYLDSTVCDRSCFRRTSSFQTRLVTVLGSSNFEKAHVWYFYTIITFKSTSIRKVWLRPKRHIKCRGGIFVRRLGDEAGCWSNFREYTLQVGQIALELQLETSNYFEPR